MLSRMMILMVVWIGIPIIMVVTANGLHKNYSTYNFMYPFIDTMHCMSVIKPLSIKLQYRANDIAYAYS